MANRTLFRRETLAAILLAAGAVTLTACSSSQPQTYRPQAGPTPVYQSPSYNSQPAPAPAPAPSYQQPTYTAPAPARKPATGGQMACGKGKCG